MRRHLPLLGAGILAIAAGHLLQQIQGHAWFATWAPIVLVPLAVLGAGVAWRFHPHSGASQVLLAALVIAPILYGTGLLPEWLEGHLLAAGALRFGALSHDLVTLIALGVAGYLVTIGQTTRALLLLLREGPDRR